MQGGTDIGDGASQGNTIDAEIERQRATNQAAIKDNSRLRASISDKQLEVEQLEKQIRKLERKIDALEDAERKRGGNSAAEADVVKKGFFKPMPRDYQCPPVQSIIPKPKVDLVEKARAAGTGIVIDSATGDEVILQETRVNDAETETNPLLRSSRQLAPEEQLMAEMQNPPESNPDFDSAKYSALIGSGKKEEADDMIRKEGGPSLAGMQKTALAMLQGFQTLDPNYCDPRNHGCSLAQWAASMGFDEVLRQLLVRRADPTHRSNGGVSCLAAASSNSHVNCARLLLEHRADPNEVTEDGETLVMWASRIEYSRQDGTVVTNPFVVELLSRRADPDIVDLRGRTALIHASTEGNAEAVQALLHAKADVDVKDNDGRTALEIALRYYHGKISGMLVPLRKKLPPAVASGQEQAQEADCR